MNIKEEIKTIKKSRTSFCELILSDIFSKLNKDHIEYYNDCDFIDFYIKKDNILFRYYIYDNILVISSQIYHFINSNDNILLENFKNIIKKHFDKMLNNDKYNIKIDDIFPLNYDFFNID